MTGITSVPYSATYVQTTTEEHWLSSPEFYNTIVVDNTLAVPLYLTTDGSNPVAGAGGPPGSLTVPANSQRAVANTAILPNWNTAPNTVTAQGPQPAGNAPWYVGKSDKVYGTCQSPGNTGFLGVSGTYTSTFASPAVFTSAAIAALGNGAIIKIGAAGIQGGNFVATTVYYVVGVSGNTFQLALTSGGAGLNGDGATTGSGTLTQQRTVFAALTAASGAAGLVNVTFE